MNDYPHFARIREHKYKINTDFRVALKCNKIAESDIQEEERSLAIIYLLFGEEGLNTPEDWEDLIKIALKYLSCDKKEINNNEDEVDMDFEQDWEYIRTSFFYDYGMKIEPKTYIHWWEFYSLLCGLSDKCILNRVRFVRTFDVSNIKDDKEKEKWIKQKEQVALKKNVSKTDEERRLDELFEKQLRKE